MLSVDLTFESLDDFSSDNVARQVPELNQLLMARRQLSNLLSYMDGKSNAKEMLTKALKNRPLLESLTRPAGAKDNQDTDAAANRASEA